MPAQHDLAGPVAQQFLVAGAPDMHDRDHDIGALAPQGRRLAFDRRDRRREFQVAGIRQQHRLLFGGAGQTDADAADAGDRAVLEAGHRRAVGAAHVGAIERKICLCHALEEDVLAEVEFVIARHENVGRDHVGERDDVLATVDARHQGG